MFESLSQKFESFFKTIKGQGKFSEKNISDISQKLKLTLLEADVHFKVAKTFVENVTQSALGKKVHESLTPAQHYIQIVHEELTCTLGSETSEINLHVKPPLVILVVGLQGSGKTTTCGKLAKFLREEKKRSPYLASLDIYRPAAIDQLKFLAEQLKCPFYPSSSDQKPLAIAKEALSQAQKIGYDTVILDTAGRLHVDEFLMNELKEIKSAIEPHEILLVADIMTGQEALRMAQRFNELLELSGMILTKTEGDAHGGAALSMKTITGKPIKFMGTGEKLEDFKPFHPDRMSRSILQMGDVLTLVEKAQKVFESQKGDELTQKLRRNDFTLQDFKDQIKQVQKLGSLTEVLGMIPGAGKLLKSVPAGVDPQKEVKKVTAIIDSMTPKEREIPEILNGHRRLRIAKGSGTQVSDVNRLLKQFLEAKKMMKKISRFGMRNPLGHF